jgi:hypothetical protein
MQSIRGEAGRAAVVGEAGDDAVARADLAVEALQQIT